MSKESSSSGPPKKKVGVEPRDLPDRQDEHGVPFEQLNEGGPSPAEQASAAGPAPRAIVQPRSLPSHEEADILRAARLLQEGKTHEEVARELRIEPLKLRRWERAYSAHFQQDLNEGDYHDTDAQLRELSDDSKEKFQGNWEQVTEKATERRVKMGPIRAKMMELSATRWLFRNEYGGLDYGTIAGVLVALLGLGVAFGYMKKTWKDPVATVQDESSPVIGLNDFTTVEHDPEAAAKVVVAFHRTPTWEDKLQYVRYPEKIRPLMEAWYEKHPEDVYFERITFAMDQSVEVGSRSFVTIGLLLGKEKGSRADDRQFIMAVERLPDGEYKIDWETSSGYQPMSVKELIKEMPTEPVELRLTLERSDFYNFGFQKDQYVAFRATYLGDPNTLFVYGRRDDPAVRQLSHSLDVRGSTGAIVKVRYPKNAKVSDQLELVEVVSENWFRDYEKG